MEIDPRYFRPTAVEFLLGVPAKAKTRLGWQPEISFAELVKVMVREDLREAKRDQLCKTEGFRTFNNFEYGQRDVLAQRRKGAEKAGNQKGSVV